MNKNTRDYFDRPREGESYGLRVDPPLRTIWQLDTPEQPPAPGESRITPKSQRSMSKSASAPDVSGMGPWDNRHHILFNKDNTHYHPNFREYFERPRDLLY